MCTPETHVRRLAFLAVLGFAACGGEAVSEDAGASLDASVDVGADRDVAVVREAGPDVGAERDSGTSDDAGAVDDVGSAHDAGSAHDVGVDHDTGSDPDAGGQDSGAEPDAVLSFDAYTLPPDAFTPSDAFAPPDARDMAGRWDGDVVAGTACGGGFDTTYTVTASGAQYFSIRVTLTLGGASRAITASCQLTDGAWDCDPITDGAPGLCVTTLQIEGTWDGADRMTAHVESSSAGALCGSCRADLDLSLSRID